MKDFQHMIHQNQIQYYHIIKLKFEYKINKRLLK